MALNFNDRQLIIESKYMLDRCTAVVVNYAVYILGNGASTDPQKSWARTALRAPVSVATEVRWYVLPDTDFTNSGSDITDNQLKGVIENAINTYFIV